MKKKVLLTGHTKGLGKAIFEEIEGDFEVTGASRSTGLDIESMPLQEFADFDILINNAYHPTGQFRVLYEIYSLWKQKEKLIINVGSAGISSPNRPYEAVRYMAAKTQLESYSRWITENDPVCKCMLFSPGFMDTELGKDVNAFWEKEVIQKYASRSLDLTYCARLVRMMMESPFRIRDMQLLP